MTDDNDTYFVEADRLYEDGQFSAAYDLFLKAAQNGCTSSMGRVACMLSSGEGVEYNLDKAEAWELKAINAGDDTLMFNIAITCRNRGKIRDSVMWFKKALSSGDYSAAIELGKFYMISDKTTDEAESYLRQALESNDLSESEIEEALNLLNELH